MFFRGGGFVPGFLRECGGPLLDILVFRFPFLVGAVFILAAFGPLFKPIWGGGLLLVAFHATRSSQAADALLSMLRRELLKSSSSEVLMSFL